LIISIPLRVRLPHLILHNRGVATFREANEIVYKNEKQVGDGLKLSHLARSDYFLTTKFSGLKTVKESIKDSLEWLGVKYVDLYLIHNPRWSGDIKDTWREMRGVKKEGWAKSIGVSKYVKSLV
jgi:diketogulonate reductase-like aldo/keto reductase